MHIYTYTNAARQAASMYAASAAGSVQRGQEGSKTSQAETRDEVEISQEGHLAYVTELDDEAAAKLETAIQNADIKGWIEAAKESCRRPVNWDRVVDPDGTIYGAAYVESLLRQYQDAENKVKAYYAEAHRDNLSRGTITDGMNYISLKYTDFGKDTGSPYYRSHMSAAERRMAMQQETAMLLGGNVTIGDPYALASSGGMINVKDADRIANQAARDKIDALIEEYRREKE